MQNELRKLGKRDDIKRTELSIPRGRICGWRLRLTSHSHGTVVDGGLRTKGEFKTTLPGKPLVTVITAVYNRALKLERTINSVFNQTYSNIEYIIIDGASTDGTLDVIRKYEDSIDYYVSEPDSGVYNAMNKGLSLATGDYICMLNSDDWFVKEAVECSVNEILRTKADYSGAEEYCVDEVGKLAYIYKLGHFDEVALFLQNPCNHGTMFISRNVYEELGYYDEQYRFASDFNLQMKLVTDKRFKHCTVRKPIHYYEIAGLTGIHRQETLREVHLILKQYHKQISDQQLQSLVSFMHDWLYDETISRDLDSILAKECYSSKQKYYLLEKIIERGYGKGKPKLQECFADMEYGSEAPADDVTGLKRYIVTLTKNLKARLSSFINKNT